MPSVDSESERQVIRGRRLSIDYGDVRIGLAISDPDCIVSTPLVAVRAQDPTLLQTIRSLLKEYEPIKIFIGLPMHLSGQESASTQKVREFSKRLQQVTEIPVEFVDERLTTVSAQEKLRNSGINARESKNLIDSMAAVEILEAGIARERSS
jgi:putative Holliday junction resolvase